jgi:hypothetical protein
LPSTTQGCGGGSILTHLHMGRFSLLAPLYQISSTGEREHKLQGDLISPLSFFQNKESRVKLRSSGYLVNKIGKYDRVHFDSIVLVNNI